MGRWLDFLVLGWLVLELTDSPFLVGVAAFCRQVPMMFLGPFAGLLADRLHRGWLMIAVQVTNLVAALTLALLFGLGSGTVWHLIVLEALLGIAWATDFPVRRTVLYTLVGPRRLANAFSLESVSMQGTKIIGPVLGGVLLVRVGPVGCYLLLAALYLAALVLVWQLNRQVSPRPIGAGESVLAGLLAGVREARVRPTILGVLAITVVQNALVLPYQQMLPVFARDVLDVGPILLGLLVAADGLGALIGALAIGSRAGGGGHRPIFAGGALLGATLVIGLAVSPWYLLSLPLQFIIGVAESGFGTMQSTLILLEAPERSRGRIVGILSACIGTQPVGTLWLGFASGLIGVSVATALSAAVGLALLVPLGLRITAAPAAQPLRTSG